MKLSHILLTAIALIAASGCLENNRSSKDQKQPAGIVPTPVPTMIISSPTMPPVIQPINHYSLGQGGQTGRYEARYTANNGASARYLVDAPMDISMTNAKGLLVYLHGDNANEVSSLYRSLPAALSAHNLMSLFVYSPDGGKRWYSSGRNHADFLNDFLKSEIFKKYNINLNQIYFVGVSGGSEFLGGYFLGRHLNNFTTPIGGGGAILLCGGKRYFDQNFTPSHETRTNFRLHFYTQERDFLFAGVKKAIDYYRSTGITVSEKLPSGGSHCGFSVKTAIEESLQLLKSNSQQVSTSTMTSSST
jgi:predicted peptidase